MNFIVNFLTKDIWRKLIALTIACVLYLNLYEYKERDLHDVKVEIRHDPDIFIDPAYQYPAVRLTVKGSKRKVNELALQHNIAGHIKLDSNVDSVRTGKARIHLRPQDFNCGKGMEITRIEPEMLEIPIQRRISSNVKIVPTITGSPQPGKVCSIHPLPASVTVSGPEQVVKSLYEISTEPFAIAGDNETFNVELKLLNPSAEHLQLSVSSTRVTVDIRDSYDITKEISVPVKYLYAALHTDSAIHLPVPNKVTVRVKGHQNDINPLNRDNITVYADLSDVTSPGEYTIPLRAALTQTGSSVQVESISPAEVKVTIPENKKANI